MSSLIPACCSRGPTRRCRFVRRERGFPGEGCLPVAEHHTLIIDVSAELGSTLPYQEQFEIGGADFLLGCPLPGYHRRGFVGANELGPTTG